MANCTDCAKFNFCPLVEDKEVDVYEDNKEKECESFTEELF